MHKNIFIYISFLLIFCVNINAKTFTDDKYLQIIAQDLEIKDNIVKANGNVVVYSLNYYITANRLIYNKDNSNLELFEDVNIVKNNKTISFSQYAFINIKNNINNFEPFLFLENSSKLWLNAATARQQNDSYELLESTLSSCDCADPAWSIGFSDGDYNSTTQWINTYDTTLYIKQFPIFYTPYFGFPTDKTRRTGLLKATIGYSRQEGLLYAQPIYFAPKLNYDLEYIPQIRNQRGYGHALKYRYADSLFSTLKFETSVFKEKTSYQEKMSLENSKHYGWNFEYKRSKLISDENSQDGLVITSLDMNDVDYINTKYDNDATDYTNKFLESKIKYFYNNNKYYTDIDLRYYNDISKKNNDDVIQNMPTINFHKYSQNILFDKLSYSADVKFSNQTRKVGLNTKTFELHLPVSYNISLFDDYLNLTLSEQINFTNIKYSNSNKNFNNANLATNNHIFSIGTNLIKPYKDYIHSVKFDTVFTYTNTLTEDGDIYNISNEDEDLNIVTIDKGTQNLSLVFNQSMYDIATLKEIVNHQVKQAFVYNHITNSYEKGDLENDLSYFYDYGSISNRLTYNYLLNEIIESSTTLKFKKDKYFLNIYNTFKKDKSTLESKRSIIYDFGINWYKYYTMSYKSEHDLANNVSKKKEYIFNINKKCWEVDFKLIDSIVATSTTDNSTLRQNILYIQFNFKQLFEFGQAYKFKERKE